jgi:hypothetical protein
MSVCPKDSPRESFGPAEKTRSSHCTILNWQGRLGLDRVWRFDIGICRNVVRNYSAIFNHFVVSNIKKLECPLTNKINRMVISCFDIKNHKDCGINLWIKTFAKKNQFAGRDQGIWIISVNETTYFYSYLIVNCAIYPIAYEFGSLNF